MEHQLYRVLALNDFGAKACYSKRQTMTKSVEKFRTLLLLLALSWPIE